MFVEDEYQSDMFFKCTKHLRFSDEIKFTDQTSRTEST